MAIALDTFGWLLSEAGEYVESEEVHRYALCPRGCPMLPSRQPRITHACSPRDDALCRIRSLRA
eukprot:7832894-Pyramimonas_sp.AAC.1